MNTISALSFWQPYAWFIVNGYADVDSRRWAPTEKHIGSRFAVHASKRKVTQAEFEDFIHTVKHLKIKNYPQSRGEFDYGKLVGTVVLKEVTKRSKSYFAHPGYFHWVLTSAKKTIPQECKGQRGWFSVELTGFQENNLNGGLR